MQSHQGCLARKTSKNHCHLASTFFHTKMQLRSKLEKNTWNPSVSTSPVWTSSRAGAFMLIIQQSSMLMIIGDHWWWWLWCKWCINVDGSCRLCGHSLWFWRYWLEQSTCSCACWIQQGQSYGTPFRFTWLCLPLFELPHQLEVLVSNDDFLWHPFP